MRRVRPVELLPVALVILVVLTVAGVALATWSGTGTGQDEAVTAVAQPVGLSGADPDADLYPGGRADVGLLITNPNLFTVRVGAVFLDTAHGTSGYAVDSDHAACPLATLVFYPQSNGGAGWVIPRRVGDEEGALQVLLPDALGMTPSGGNACQGAELTAFLKVGP